MKERDALHVQPLCNDGKCGTIQCRIGDISSSPLGDAKITSDMTGKFGMTSFPVFV